uniref:ATP-binding protein n=1 Tax=Cohaesibacter celericrescens TaxID=2067669 RepID=UPI003563DF88
PESYTGKNFGFRPYFKEAMAGRLGQFYGIGIVSSTPGFFIAYGLKSDDTIIGAVAIEIHLTDLETVWRSGPDDILVSDVNDVIFLSSNESWKHKSFGKSGASIDDNPAALDRFNNGVTNPIAQKICYRIGDITFYKNPLFSCIFPEKLSLKEEIVEFGWTIHSIQSARYIYNSVALIVSISVLLYLTLIFLYRNITNKYNRSIQKIRNQLLENSKLAAIGQMATEVAHEFNQPLSAIYMLLDTSRLLLKRKRYHDVDDNLVLISSHIEKLTQQISELKGFASRHRVPRGKANIVSAANASIRLFQLTLKKHNVKLFLQVRHDAIQVPCNEIGLEQIFSNLITNALEAMGDQSDKVIVIMIVRVKGRVIVKVRDNGCGIPDPTKIFESFYSTKQRGTGLGLAIVNGIVENSDGTISVRNHPKGGAEFTLSWSEWREEQADSTETPN